MTGKTPQRVDVLVGRRVRMRRLMLNMSQETLADKLGLTFQQVQKYENAANRISASRLQQIADALEVPIGFLFEDEGRIPPGWTAEDDRLSDFLSTKDALALLDAFTRISDRETRRRIVALTEVIACRDAVLQTEKP